MRHIVLSKKRGQTPLQAIEDWKLLNPEYKDMPACYAGRLDPLAEGKLLVLLGDECKRQKAYHGLDKEYEIEVLLDLSTDTGDALGMPACADKETFLSSKEIRQALKNHTGAKTVPYPAFSSKTVNGRPLFAYALEGTLDTISIPTHTERIFRIRHLSTVEIRKDELAKRIEDILSNVPRSDEPSKVLGADFRQDDIRAAWSSVLAGIPERNFCVMRLRITCGSGTYMRTLAERIGSDLGTPGMALSIRRTRIGKFLRLGKIVNFWSRQY